MFPCRRNLRISISTSSSFWSRNCEIFVSCPLEKMNRKECSTVVEETLSTSFSRAYYTTRDGKKARPPVHIVDLTKFQKGNGLLASRDIEKGETIWTEVCHTTTAIQIPNREMTNGRPFGPVRACENCFASLEPLSTYFDKDYPIPQACLWPVPEYSPELEAVMTATTTTNKTTLSSRYLKDHQGRFACQGCQIIFCSHQCKQVFLKEVAEDCCRYRAALGAIADIVFDKGQNSYLADHWEIVLAMRLFCSILTGMRITNTMPGDSVLGKQLDGMCGVPTNSRYLDEDDSSTVNILKPVYRAFFNIFQLKESESTVLSQSYFERLIIVCRRNTLDVKTKSPFAIYEENVLQNDRGDSKGSDDLQLSKAFAKFLLQNANAGDIEEIAGQVHCCVLLPLFSKTNHACEPNVDIIDGLSSISTDTGRSSQIQLISIRDIAQGEELLVSYLSPHAIKLNESQRNLRLKSRYFFTCRCSRCVAEQISRGDFME